MARTTSKKVTTKPDYRTVIRSIPYYEKYLLTAQEACAYFHIGEGKMYELLREYEGAKWVLRNGNRLMIKKNLFARWLDQQSEI